MVKRFMSLQFQLLVIAISLAVITTILGLSAYITQQDSYSAYFRTASVSDLGFSITGETFDEQNIRMVTPGDSIDIGAAAQVTGDILTKFYIF